MSKSRDIADSAATISHIGTVTSNVQSQINTVQSDIDTFDPLPAQIGNEGKYLSTDGSTTAWQALETGVPYASVFKFQF